MFDFLKQATARFRWSPPTLEEIALALEEKGMPCTADDIRDFQSRIGERNLPGDPDERQRRLYGEVDAAWQRRLLDAQEARANEKSSRPRVSGTDIMRHVAKHRYAEYAMHWTQEADGLTLTVDVRRFGHVSLDLDATLKKGEKNLLGTVRLRLNVDLLNRRVEFAELFGNGPEGLHRKGLGRLLTDIGNRVLKETLPGETRVAGKAFNTDEDIHFDPRPEARHEWSAARQRRIDFWRNTGVAFEEEDVTRYVALETLEARFAGTVEGLIVRAPAGQMLLDRFDMFPPLSEFQGEPPAVRTASVESTPSP